LCFENLQKYFDKEEQIQKILDAKNTLNTQKIDKIIKDLEISLIPITDNHYPENLKQIVNSPYFLYVRGNIYTQDHFFAIV
jgi:predicted Rossmann fold nucleotide-binding protein DprA/Smf involved in DNA uptake